MKKITIALLCILINLCVLSQVIKKSGNHIHFKISEVKLADSLLSESGKLDVIENHIGSKIESYSLINRDQTLVETKMHSFLSALHYCFAQHRPLSISPDMIWLMITQSVCLHIELNAELLRDRIVFHDKKKNIKVRNDSLVIGNSRNKWHDVFPSFSDSIKKYTCKDFYRLAIPKFSTTTLNENLAYQITLMDAVNSYFDYIVDTECGIPSIIIEGKKNDWQWILNNIDEFNKYGLGEWTKELKPILKQFIEARKGNINKNFWKSIYMLKEDCTDIYISGWIMKFFPYKYENGSLIQNSNISKSYDYCNIKFNSIPGGISSAKFKWNYMSPFQDFVQVYNMELGAGFIGISQDSNNYALRPEINWYRLYSNFR